MKKRVGVPRFEIKGKKVCPRVKATAYRMEREVSYGNEARLG